MTQSKDHTSDLLDGTHASWSRRRFLGAGAVGVAGVAGGAALLVGCGDDDSASTTTTTAPADSGESTTPTTEAPAAGITGEVVIWHPYSQPERQAALQQAYDAFTDANPGATVVSEVVGWGDFAGRWPAAQAAGELPDIAINTSETLLAAHNGGAVNSGANQALVDALGGESFFPDGYFDKGGRINGQIFNLPHYAHNRLHIYRKDRLQASGLSVPSTMEETLAVAEALSSPPDYYGIIHPLAQGDVAASYLLWIMTRAHGGSLIGADGTSFLNSDEVGAAAEFMRQWLQFGPKSAAEITQSDMFNLAYSGELSSEVNGAAVIGVGFSGNSDFPQEIAEALDGTHMPFGPDGGRGDLLAAVSMTITDGGNPDGAVALGQSLYQDDNLLTFLQSIPLFMFPQTNNIDQETFLSHPVIAQYPDVVEQTITGIREGSVPGFENGPNQFAGPVFASDVIEIAMQEIVLEGRAVSDALADAHDGALAVIEDEQRRLGG